MTPEAFTKWLADMKSAGQISTKQDAARLLGVSDDTVTNYLKRGGPVILALACAALLPRTLAPYE